MNKIIIISIVMLALTKVIYSQKTTYFITHKGIYVNYKKTDGKLKVPFKEYEEFYFSLKNDSTALIQEIYKGKIKNPKVYKISSNFDTAYVRRYSIVNGKKKQRVEKIIFQRVY